MKKSVTGESSKNTKRNSCILITAVIIILILVFAYVASKEVSNAFKHVDEGLVKTNQSAEKSNEALKNVLIKHNEYGQTVKEIERISVKFNSLIDSTINQLIMQTGGWNENVNPKELANPKNYDVPTRILVIEKLGDKLEQAILETNTRYNEIIKAELNVDSLQLPLKLNIEHIKNSEKNWTQFNFGHMPLMAVLPILRKFQNDENESKAIIYRYIANEK